MNAPPLAGAGSRRGAAALLLALAAVPYLIGLGAPPLWDANEPLYAEPPREALEIGTLDALLAPPWNYRPWFVRPPLTAWLTVPSYAVLGEKEAAARLPAALAAVATTLAVFALGRATGGRTAGLLAALVLAATPRWWSAAREFPGDVLEAATLTGAFALAVPALRGVSGGARRMAGAHALVAVGCLSKGPVVLVLWVATLVVVAFAARPRVPWRALRPVALVVAVVLLGAPWFVYMTVRFGAEYPRVFFGWHHVRRVFSDDVGSRPPLYYLPVLLAEAQPWLLLVPFAVRHAVRTRARDPVSVLAWAGAVLPLLLFSLSQAKRNVYLLPIYPCLAVALAPWLAEVWRGAKPAATRWLALALVAAFAALVVVVAVAQSHLPEDVAHTFALLAAATAVAGAPLLVAAWRGRGAGVLAAGLAAMLVLETAAALALPVLARYRPVPGLARTLSPLLRPDDEVVVYAAALHSPMFYLRRHTSVAADPEELARRVPPGGRAWLFASASAVDALRRRTAEGTAGPFVVEEVARRPYLRLAWRTAVLGRGPATYDLVLVRVERPAARVSTPGD